MDCEVDISQTSATIAKAPAFTLPALPVHKRDFLKWENEMKTYLNLYGETGWILMNEVKDLP